VPREAVHQEDSKTYVYEIVNNELRRRCVQIACRPPGWRLRRADGKRPDRFTSGPRHGQRPISEGGPLENVCVEEIFDRTSACAYSFPVCGGLW
jgi:hypothetical protein